MTDQALTKVEGPVEESTAIIQVIERAAANPEIDVDKMERLLQMQERILDRNAKVEFSNAMAQVQSHLPKVIAKSKNTQTGSLYAKHEAISKAIKPVYTEHGFSTTFTQDVSPLEGCIRIKGTLMHRSGHERDDYFIDLPMDDVGIQGKVNKTKVHAIGSTFSYGRRYLTLLMFDVATGDDDDGNAAGLPPITEEQLANLKALIEEVGADEPKFLTYYKIDALEHLPAQAYDNACHMLRHKGKTSKPKDK